MIGGKVAPFVRVLMLLFYVFAKPVSLVLDAYLGVDIGTVFTKRQLAEMIEIHETQQMIDAEERDILRGAMSFRAKSAESIMTPVDQVFMLPISFFLGKLMGVLSWTFLYRFSKCVLNIFKIVHITATLDQQTIHDILKCRFSRILIFDTSASDIVGTIHVKDLVFVDPKVHSLSMRTL